MRQLIFLITLAFIAQYSNAANPPTPETFGIMTMTYSRGGDNTMFEGYLKHYAEMECPIITEINIVWNNQKAPAEMGVYKNSQNWKRPINFYLTPYNSLNWRYKIPVDSKQKVFFYVDDDNIVACQEIIKGFRMWQDNAIGQLGPIVSYHIREFQYTNGQPFTYSASPKLFYSIGLLSAAFVSAHVMDIYYADIWELQEVRRIVTEKNNCEDIALDFIVSFYYPELLTRFVEGKTQGLQGVSGVSKAGNHMQKRSECINQFTYIFGFNAFRFQPIHDKFPNVKRWTLPFRNETLLARKQYFERDVLRKKGAQLKVESDQILGLAELKHMPESTVMYAVLVLVIVLVAIAVWKIKEEMFPKSNNSRVLTIQMDQPGSETPRSSLRSESRYHDSS